MVRVRLILPMMAWVARGIAAAALVGVLAKLVMAIVVALVVALLVVSVKAIVGFVSTSSLRLVVVGGSGTPMVGVATAVSDPTQELKLPAEAVYERAEGGTTDE